MPSLPPPPSYFCAVTAAAAAAASEPAALHPSASTLAMVGGSGSDDSVVSSSSASSASACHDANAEAAVLPPSADSASSGGVGVGGFGGSAIGGSSSGFGFGGSAPVAAATAAAHSPSYAHAHAPAYAPPARAAAPPEDIIAPPPPPPPPSMPPSFQVRSDEDLARLFAAMEARRHREEEERRLESEAESLQVAMELQAAEDRVVEERRRRSALEEEEGYRAAVALQSRAGDDGDEDGPDPEAGDDCDGEAEEKESSVVEWSVAPKSSLGGATPKTKTKEEDADSDAASAHAAAEEEDRKIAAKVRKGEGDERAMASMVAAEAAARFSMVLAGMSMAASSAAMAAADGTLPHGGDAGTEVVLAADGSGVVRSDDEEAALRLARAIQAQDEMDARDRGDAASLELALALEEQERKTFRGGEPAGGSGMGSSSLSYPPSPAASLAPGAAAWWRSSPVPSLHGRSLSDPMQMSSSSSDVPEIFRSDSAADLVRKALHHGPLRLRREEAWSRLTPRQREALGYVDCVARDLHDEAMPALRARALSLGYADDDVDACLAYVRDDAPVIVHLKTKTLRHLCSDPWYRSQFETGTSGGTLDRKRRQRWEDAMFGAAYADAPDEEHPKYGCLNITGDILGVRGARGYGKLYLTLAPSVRYRTSFSNKDTGQQAGKSKMATNDWYGHVLAEYSDDELRTVFRVSGASRIGGAPSSAFAQYKECQIHGTLSMATDVLALSVPGRRDDASEELADLVERFRRISGCTILWQGDLIGD